jgi:hypothetical protein
MVVSLAGNACSGQGSKSTSTTTTSRGSRCARPAVFDRARGNEVRAVGSKGQAWGLVMGPHVPPRLGDPLKIVWRVTGSGPLDVRLIRPDGRSGTLTFGPEPHAVSTYHRPGDEWGTGYRFDQRGCWTITLSRAGTLAGIDVLIE